MAKATALRVTTRYPVILPLGTELAVTLKTLSGPIRVEGSVVWAESPDRRRVGQLVSHGLRFTSVDWSISLAVDLFLAHSNQPQSQTHQPPGAKNSRTSKTQDAGTIMNATPPVPRDAGRGTGGPTTRCHPAAELAIGV